MNYKDNIQDYLDGLLSGQDLIDFKKDLVHNNFLQQEVKAYEDAKKLSEGLIEMDLKNVLDQQKIDGKLKLVKRLKLIWGIAGAAVLFGLLYYFLIYNKGDVDPVLFAEAYTEPLWPTTRANNQDDLQVAIAQFLNGGDIDASKSVIINSDNIDPILKNYWISEMYLRNEVLDSVEVYLPDFDPNHVKYERSQLVRDLLTKYNN